MQQTTSGDTAAEVRQVTILKCDIVDSTRITTPLPPTLQWRFETDFLEMVDALATDAEARVQRFEGDGAFLSLMGEDAGKRLLELAHDLVARVGAWAFVDEKLRIRIGVASGSVLAMKGSSLHGLAGNTINRAQRLLQAAGDDEILVCEQTQRLAGGFFSNEAVGVIAAKGFPEGIAAWRLGPSRVVSRFEATRSHGPIIGRAAMLETVAGCWRDALAGRSHLAWLCGDAGIGKSRLARVVLDVAEAEAATTVTLDCSPSTSNTPLFPVTVFLRRRAELTSAMSREEAADRLRGVLQDVLPKDDVPPALGHLGALLQLPVDAPAPGGTLAEVQERTISHLVEIFDQLFAKRPGLLLCEDLHWADDSTLRLIARLCARLEGRRVLLLATSRRAPPKILLDLPRLVEIPVAPLDADSTLELVRRLAADIALPDTTVRTIAARSEGVPLMIEELTRAAVVLPAAPRAGGDVPLSLKLVVESRLDQNPELAKAAKMASAIGREVHLPLLASLTGSDAATINGLVDAGFLDLPGGDSERARFHHALIRDAIYETVPEDDLPEIHWRIAKDLQGPFAGAPDATPELLADHLRLAQRFPQAIEILQRAAADTDARGAFVECEGHCEAGIRICHELEKTDPAGARRLEYELTVQKAVALVARLGFSDLEVEKAYRRAAKICPDDVKAGDLCPILHGLSGVNLLCGRLRAAHELALQGLSLAERWDNVALVIDALSMLAYTSFYFRPHRETLGFIERCLALYDENDGRELKYPMPYNAKAAALGPLPTVRWMLGDPARADAEFERGVRHVEGGRAIDVALMQGWFAGFRITQQRWSACEAHSDLGALASEEFANWRDLARISKWMGVAHRTAARRDARRAVAAVRWYEKSGARVSVAHYCAGLARACIRAGDPALAAIVVDHGLARSAESEETWMLAELNILKAGLESDEARAIGLLHEALAQAEDFGSVAVALMACAELAARQGLAETALARETLAIFAGAEPPEPDWMRPRLAILREVVTRPVEMTPA